MVTITQKEQAKVLIVHKNRFERTTINKDGTYTQETPIAHPYGTIEKIRTDNNENFIFLIVQRGETKKLCILNRKTLELIDEIDDIADIIYIDGKNDLTCLNTAGNTVQINSNFDQFPKGYVDGNMVIAES